MRRLTERRAVAAVAAITAVGLAARFLFAGSRVFHFDEARVAWWGLDYLRSGAVQYRFIIHGPFLQYVHRPLFAALGPTDFAALVPVALVGGLLPLVALWFRHRLSRAEVVAVAFFFAFNPVLLYYSRFVRSTLLVAAFSLLAFAAFLRTYDGFGVRYLYVGAAALALAFAAKENAVVYVLCWLGAAALVADTALFRPRAHDSGRQRVVALAADLRARYDRDPAARRRLLGHGGHLAAAGLVFSVVALFFFAPRGGEAGLWTGNLDATLSAAADDVVAGFEYWFGEGGETDVSTYLERLGLFLGVMARYAGPLALFAAVGFFYERYWRADSRPLVLFCTYWGAASVVGYPLGTDIWGAWVVVNALVPLAVPAAVGLGAVTAVGRRAVDGEDTAVAAVAAAIVLLVGAQVAVVGAAAVYANPTGPDNGLVQFAQPEAEMDDAVDATAAAAAANEAGADALFYGGEEFVTMDETARRTPACINWFRTLPWAWYLDANDVAVTCATGPEGIPGELPPVVVAEAECTLERTADCRTNPEALAVDPALEERVPDSYERYGFLHRTTGGGFFDGMVVYVDTEQ